MPPNFEQGATAAEERLMKYLIKGVASRFATGVVCLCGGSTDPTSTCVSENT
jgi:hypothetical protein